MSGHKYVTSSRPFDDDDDIDDETFLKNSRRSDGPSPTFDEQIQTFQERKKAIEDRTLNSTEKSLSVLRESEQIGVATAEELMRQREKLEKTDRQLDEINATLRFSQKHINGIKSVFSSLKNYISRKNETIPPAPTSNNKTSTTSLNEELEEKLTTYDRFENHPNTRIRGLDYISSQSSSGSKDFSARLDANLQEMSVNISRLKGLASDMQYEIDSQNDLIGTIIEKTDKADVTISKQNKEMMRIMKKS